MEHFSAPIIGAVAGFNHPSDLTGTNGSTGLFKAEGQICGPSGQSQPVQNPLGQEAFHLIGQIGTTTTPLRPTGKARFGDLIVDATAQTGSLENQQSVEVVATRGLRVIVRDVRSPDSRLIERASDPFHFDEDLFKS